MEIVHKDLFSQYNKIPLVYGIDDYKNKIIKTEVRFVYNFKTTQIFIKAARLEENKFHFVISHQLLEYIDFVDKHLAKKKLVDNNKK